MADIQNTLFIQTHMQQWTYVSLWKNQYMKWVWKTVLADMYLFAVIIQCSNPCEKFEEGT